MNKIDLESIITDNNLDAKELASELFPEAMHPKLALDRIIKGKGLLDSDQISKLSSFTGIPINYLFSISKWKKTSIDKKLIFEWKDYKAVMNMENYSVELYHKNSIFHETVLINQAIPLSEFLEKMEQLIDEYNQK